MTIWHNPAQPPAIISLWTGNFPSFVVNLYRKKSFAANFMAFSGVIRRILTADPRYIPKNPSERKVLRKQSNMLEYIFSPAGPTCNLEKILIKRKIISIRLYHRKALRSVVYMNLMENTAVGPRNHSVFHTKNSNKNIQNSFRKW